MLGHTILNFTSLVEYPKIFYILVYNKQSSHCRAVRQKGAVAVKQLPTITIYCCRIFKQGKLKILGY